MNLLQIETQVRQLEGHENDDSVELRTHIRASINLVYQSLAAEEPWNWLMRTDSLTPEAGGETLLLPLDWLFLVSVKAPDATMPMEPCDRQIHVEMEDEILSGRFATYAVEGVDDTTGRSILYFSPVADVVAHDVRLGYMPAELTADTDIPKGPEALVSHYLVWKVRHLRLLGDEERETLILQTEQLANLAHRQLKALNSTRLSSLERRAMARGMLA